MPIEATLKRQLDIRFIDARELVVEAKLNLDITSYPSQNDEHAILDEATRIFFDRSMGFKDRLQTANVALESSKEECGASVASPIPASPSMSSGSSSPNSFLRPFRGMMGRKKLGSINQPIKKAPFSM